MSFKVDLNDLLARESEQVEWKEHVAEPADVARTITAFANDFSNLGGGYVVCGAKEEKDPHGFARVVTTGLTASELKRLEGKILDLCRLDISPPITPLLEEIPLSEERKILVFLIPSSKQAHSFRQKTDTGKYYIRRGKATEEARNGLLRELLSKKDVIEPWDRRCHPDATVEDIDLLAFRELLQQLGCWDPRRSIDEYLHPSYRISPLLPSFCVREPLTNQLRPRNFTLLLVARNLAQFYPEAHTIFSLYTGTEISEPYAERKEMYGTLLSQASKLLELLNTEAFHLFKKTDELPNVVKYLSFLRDPTKFATTPSSL